MVFGFFQNGRAMLEGGPQIPLRHAEIAIIIRAKRRKPGDLRRVEICRGDGDDSHEKIPFGHVFLFA